MRKSLNLIFSFLLVCGIACDTEQPEIEQPDEVPEVYQKIYGATDIYIDGEFVVIEAAGTPDHKSPYYVDTQWENELHEVYNGSNPNWHLNPNRISAGNYSYRIPLNPEKATNHSPTALGSIGVSLNGVAFYNQYAGPNNQPLTNEINSFDQYNGHPQQQGQYHYHVEPLYLTGQKGSDALLGFLLDGFPVYGPEEEGQMVNNDDLDEFHGHEHATADYPDGIYHYHITSEDPYLNGSGYYGTPGTVTR